MKWDVFVSHASEDKDFVRKLVEALQEWGLRVWFDELTLQAGDSLRRSIDQGLSESEYGIVVLSSSFFAKEWPQKELDGLVGREDGKSKVIIPIWHNVSAEEVRKFSPPLVDRLSIYSNGPIETIAEKVLRAIYQNRGTSNWHSLPTQLLPDGTEIVLLPIHPKNNLVLGIGKYPITNLQYQRFVNETEHSPPIGEEFRNTVWSGPFIPWDHAEYNNLNQPVVCVGLKDALAYCDWASHLINPQKSRNRYYHEKVFLPSALLWDFAAFGQRYLFDNTLRKISVDKKKIHHKSNKPAEIDITGARDNNIGISDMFGNIWEWCSSVYHRKYERATLMSSRILIEAELRGGGFMDDLTKIRPYLRTSMLEDGINTRHTDLGFRVAVVLRTSEIQKEILITLQLQERLPSEFWEVCLSDYPYSYYE